MAFSASFSRSFSLLVIFSFLSLRFSSALRPGGRSAIPNVKSNTEVQDLGKFCVEKYNQVHDSRLVFSEVVQGERQVVSGMKYYLLIEAKDGDVLKKFDAVVVVQAWRHSKQMLSFSPSTD
ncbi:hypothetical protein AMTRI_Chr06g195630 [Amborella trichopoda]|uniref:Cystatin domain-containing protein n=1 Tax=Amborella trichopoda TaxID=13333 RepID=W1P3S1_AMBTC|nr:hypothetical protein AMTR_s00087p00084520 [Amborella trichopoda]